MNSNAAPFVKMSERVERNADFGGACVIVFPGNPAPEPIEMLIVDPKSSLPQFLATITTRLQMIQQELEAAERRGAFGGR